VCNGQDTDACRAYGIHNAIWETADELFPYDAVYQWCGFRVCYNLDHGAFDLIQKRLAESWTKHIVVAGRVIEFLLGHRMEGDDSCQPRPGLTEDVLCRSRGGNACLEFFVTTESLLSP